MTANTPPKPHTEGMEWTNTETGIKYQFSGGAWRAVSSEASEEVADAISKLDLQTVLDNGNVADKPLAIESENGVSVLEDQALRIQHTSNPYIRLVDETDSAILSNITTVTLARFITPNITDPTSYTLNFNNPFFHPHDGHNADAGGIVASTGFFINAGSTEYFFDDDGKGNLRIYSLVSGVRTYLSTDAGTVDYTNGTIQISAVGITSVSNVDGSASTRFRITVLPDSNDVIPVRNQLLEIDTINTAVVGTIDQTATTGRGYTVTTTGGAGSTTGTATTTTTTVSTTSSTATSSSY